MYLLKHFKHFLGSWVNVAFYDLFCCLCLLASSLSASSRIGHLLPEEQVYLSQQSGTIRLDCFTHCLIVKCTADILVSSLNI